MSPFFVGAKWREAGFGGHIWLGIGAGITLPRTCARVRVGKVWEMRRGLAAKFKRFTVYSRNKRVSLRLLDTLPLAAHLKNDPE